MSERLGFHKIDTSVLSRVLKGERILTQKQLSIFSKIMKLKTAEEKRLKLSLHSEIYSRFQGKFLLDVDINQFLDMAESSSLMIKEANENGSSVLALQWAMVMEVKLRDEIIKSSEPITIGKLRELLFGLLEQHSISILRREMPDKALMSVWPVLEEMMSIAKELKSREKVGLTYAKMGDVLSLVGGLHNVKSVLKKSSLLLKKSSELIGNGLLIYPLGYAMLNEAYMNDTNEFEKLKTKVYKTIPSATYSDACEAYNLMAKSKVCIGHIDNLEKDFINGWEYQKKIPDLGRSSKIYRKVQLSRTEVQAAISGYKFRNLKDLKTIITEGLLSAREFGYRRYYLTTKQMLSGSQELLNIDLNLND